MIFELFREIFNDFVSIFFAADEALFFRKEQKKKRYKDVVKVRLIPLCKMRLYLCFIRKRDILSCDLRLIASLV